MLGGLWAKKLSSPSSFCNGARSEMLTHVPLTAEWGCLWLADIVAKLFLGWRTKILKPLMRFTRGDVRDHIGSSKIDHGRPWWR